MGKKKDKFCIFCHRERTTTGKKPKCQGLCKKRMVFLMQGLPSCGKSYTAKLVAGKSGVIIETDSYYAIRDKKGKIIGHNWDKSQTPKNRELFFKDFKKAIKKGVMKIVLDRANNKPGKFINKLCVYAVQHGYELELVDPISPWWPEIKALLKHKENNIKALKERADFLSHLNKNTHGASSIAIFRRMMKHCDMNATIGNYLYLEDYKKFKKSKKLI